MKRGKAWRTMGKGVGIVGKSMSFRFGNKYMMRYNNAWIKDLVDWTWMSFNDLDINPYEIHFPDDFKSAYRGEQNSN